MSYIVAQIYIVFGDSQNFLAKIVQKIAFFALFCPLAVTILPAAYLQPHTERIIEQRVAHFCTHCIIAFAK